MKIEFKIKMGSKDSINGSFFADPTEDQKVECFKAILEALEKLKSKS